jgi:hypothetical protein
MPEMYEPEYGSDSSRVRFYNGYWVVEVYSPVAARGWIVQGEHKTKEAAEADCKNWMSP